MHSMLSSGCHWQLLCHTVLCGCVSVGDIHSARIEQSSDASSMAHQQLLLSKISVFRGWSKVLEYNWHQCWIQPYQNLLAPGALYEALLECSAVQLLRTCCCAC